MTPEGLYGRRKMTALVRRALPDASPGSVDRAMRSLGLQGIRRSKGIRTTIPAKDGRRAGDLLNRDFTAGAEPDLGDGHPMPTSALDVLCRPSDYADVAQGRAGHRGGGVREVGIVAAS